MLKTNLVPVELTFFAWMELPYYIGVPYSAAIEIPLWSQTIQGEVTLRNDLLRLDTWNRWTHPLPADGYFAGLGESWIDPIVSDFRFAPRYCAISEIEAVTALLRANGAPYIHATETESVVEISGKVNGRMPTGPWDDLMDALPWPDFWTSEVLPHVAKVIDTYRIATVPLFRYSLHPVSEAVVSSGVAELRDGTGRIIQQVQYGFDARNSLKGYDYLIEKHDVRTRFNGLMAGNKVVDYENEMSVAYCLYHMRRWSESLVIASSVVDALLKDAVSSSARSEDLAKVIWSGYRTRSEDLFKDVLPSLGLGHFPTDAPTLWAQYKSARANRGAFAHGKGALRFGTGVEQQTKADLAAFAGAARWISLQIQRPWALDVPDIEQPDRLLPEFP